MQIDNIHRIIVGTGDFSQKVLSALRNNTKNNQNEKITSARELSKLHNIIPLNQIFVSNRFQFKFIFFTAKFGLIKIQVLFVKFTEPFLRETNPNLTNFFTNYWNIWRGTVDTHFGNPFPISTLTKNIPR